MRSGQTLHYHTVMQAEAKTLTREHSLQAIESASLEVPGRGLTRATMEDFFESASQLDPNQRQLGLAEAATRTLLNFLEAKRPLYPEFESLVWQQFLKSDNLEAEIDSLLNSQERLNSVPREYYDFVRGMFGKSGKTRHEFYRAMLSEAAFAAMFDGISFGEAAISFLKKTKKSVHQEHLLVFYSVELLIRAYAAAYPGSSPISDERLETFYQHFEAAIPLPAKFERYTKEDTLFLYSARHWLLPAIN